MSTGSAVFPINRWLYTTLANDATLTALVGGRVYENNAPAGATYPFIVFALVSAPEDVASLPGYRIMGRALYQVIAWVKGSSLSPAEAIVSRLDALLHRPGQPVNSDVAGGAVISSVREREAAPPLELEGGTYYRGIGGEYRIQAQGA